MVLREAAAAINKLWTTITTMNPKHQRWLCRFPI